MSRNEEAWKDVGDRFSSLGKKFRQHYESTDTEKSEEGGPSSDEIKKAFDTISDGLERVFGSLGAAVRDDEVKAESKAAASALVDALGATVEDLVDGLGVAVGPLGVVVRKTIKGTHEDLPAEEPAPQEAEPQTLEAKPDEAAETLREDLQDDA